MDNDTPRSGTEQKSLKPEDNPDSLSNMKNFGLYIKSLAARFSNTRTPQDDLEQYGLLLALEGMTKNQIRSRMFDYAYSPSQCEVFGGYRGSPIWKQSSDDGLIANVFSPETRAVYLDYCEDKIDEFLLTLLYLGCDRSDLVLETGYTHDFIEERLDCLAAKIRKDT